MLRSPMSASNVSTLRMRSCTPDSAIKGPLQPKKTLVCADQQLQSLKMEPPTVDSSAVKKTDSLQTTEKRYVLVLYTGGTIGMKESPDGKSACDACKLVSF